jgi:hypothetical protein
LKSINLNITVFIVALLCIALLTFASFIGAMINDQGNTLSSSLFVGLFKIFRFPTHTLMFDFFNKTTTLYFLGLSINSCIYALLTERLFLFIKRKRID